MEEENRAAVTDSNETAGRLMEAADRHLELYEMDEAMDLLNKALAILLPKREFEEQAAWAYAALGDCYFIQGDLREALRSYIKAFNLPNGYANAYVLLRAGQVYHEMGNEAQARYYLLQAYLIEGDSLFEGEDPKYFQLIGGDELLREDAFADTGQLEPSDREERSGQV